MFNGPYGINTQVKDIYTLSDATWIWKFGESIDDSYLDKFLIGGASAVPPDSIPSAHRIHSEQEVARINQFQLEFSPDNAVYFLDPDIGDPVFVAPTYRDLRLLSSKGELFTTSVGISTLDALREYVTDQSFAIIDDFLDPFGAEEVVLNLQPEAAEGSATQETADTWVESFEGSKSTILGIYSKEKVLVGFTDPETAAWVWPYQKRVKDGSANDSFARE